jgi:hypothetical protein
LHHNIPKFAFEHTSKTIKNKSDPKKIKENVDEMDDEDLLDNISLFKTDDAISANSDDLFAGENKSSESNL